MSAFDKISHGFKSLEHNIGKEVGNALFNELGLAGPNGGGNLDVLNSMKGVGQDLPQGFPQVNDLFSGNTDTQSLMNQAFQSISQEGASVNMLQPAENIIGSIEQQFAGGQGNNLLGDLTGGQGGLGDIVNGLIGGEGGGLGNLLGGLSGEGGLVGDLVGGLLGGGGAGGLFGIVEEVAPLALAAL
jgi:hypothetical protein